MLSQASLAVTAVEVEVEVRTTREERRQVLGGVHQPVAVAQDVAAAVDTNADKMTTPSATHSRAHLVA